MKTIKNSYYRELVAEEGKVLTQAADVPAEERIYTPAVCLGKGTRADAWKEVDPPAPADDWEDPNTIE